MKVIPRNVYVISGVWGQLWVLQTMHEIHDIIQATSEQLTSNLSDCASLCGKHDVFCRSFLLRKHTETLFSCQLFSGLLYKWEIGRGMVYGVRREYINTHTSHHHQSQFLVCIHHVIKVLISIFREWV